MKAQSNYAISPVNIIKWLVLFAFTFLPFAFETNEVFTDKLQLFFAITTFCILSVAFEFFDAIIPAILLPSMYLLFSVVPANVAYASWTSGTVWMILGAMILANVLEECGLLPRIAYWCIIKCGASFTGVMFGVFFAGIALNFITFCQAFIIMMVFGYGVVQALKLKPSLQSGLICFAAMLGGEGAPSSFLYNPGYLALAEDGVRQIIPEFTAVWYEMIIYNGSILFLFIFILWLLAKFYKTKDFQLEGGKEYFEQKYKELGPVKPKEMIAIVVLVILMTYLFTTPWHKLPAAYGFMVLPYVLFLPIFSVGSTAAVKKINFSIFFFIVSCLGIGSVGGYLGFGKLLSVTVTPILENSSAFVALMSMIFCGMLANLFMTPYAMMAGLSYPFTQIGLDLGLQPMASIMALVASTDLIIFPYEVAPYLLMFGFGMISLKDFMKFNILKIILTFIFFAVVMYPMWNAMGLLYL